MRLATKLIIGDLVPVALIWVVAFYAFTSGERWLRESIERSSAMQVRALMDEIDRDMRGWIREWESYVQNPLVREEISRSDEEFATYPDVAAVIDERDSLWREATADQPPERLRGLMTNAAAVDLRRRLEELDSERG